MASANMKAVITLTADARGVTAGVNSALAQLNKLQNAAMEIRGILVAGVVGNLVRNAAQAAMGEFSRLKDLGSEFSPQGMQAAQELASAQFASDVKLGQAFGEFAEQVDRIKMAELRELTDYLVQNKDAIGEAMVNIAIFGAAIADLTAQLVVGTAKLINRAASEPGLLLAESAARGALMMASPGAYGPAQSVAIDEIVRILRERLGGN